MAKEYLIDRFIQQLITYAATISVILTQSREQIVVSVTGNLTLNLDAASLPNPGDKMSVKIISDASVRTVTFGTNITGANLVTVANKTHTMQFEYDGAAYIAISPNVQID